MLSIGSMSAGKGHYYTHLAREDYYLEGGEPPGQWIGGGAKKLGLEGEVSADQLQALLQGFHPEDGRKLVQNAGKDTGTRKRQAGLDLCFSADKSVSVAWAMGDQDTRKAIEGAHHRAVQVALGYLQQEAAWTRTGQGGVNFEQCELVFAAFQHSTSRAQDMNLHTHVLAPNVGLRSDGGTSALWNNELYQHKMAAGALYRAALAYELGPRGLGYAIEPHAELKDGKQSPFFRLGEVAQKVCDKFSKRRAQIEEQMQEHGHSTAKSAAYAALATREVKGHVARSELDSIWEAQLKELGYTPEMIPEVGSKKVEFAARNLTPPIAGIAETLAEQRAVFRPQDLVRAVAENAQLDGLTSPEDLLRAVREHLASPEIQTVAEGKRHPVLSTRTQLNAEGHILKLGAQLAEKRGLTVSFPLAETMKAKDQGRLDTLERHAAFDYLTTDSGNLKILAGVAGTGKTSLLGAAREAWERQGLRVVGMALAGTAARELQSGAGIESETVRMREMQLAPTLQGQCDYHGKQLLRAAQYGTRQAGFNSRVQHGLEGLLREGKWGKAPGYKDGPMDRMKLDSKTVVVIDESSMLGLEDMGKMLRLASRAGAKVVLVGDEGQLPAIESVSAFQALGERFGRFELSEIKRQEEEWMREAVRSFADGDSQTGLSLLKENGALHMSTGGPQATKEKLVADWMETRRGGRVTLVESLLPDVIAPRVRTEDTLILTGTNADAKELNALAQGSRQKGRELGRIPVTLGSGEKAHRGDRILFERNHRHLGVWNGDIGTIVKVHDPINVNPLAKGEVTVELDHGKRVRVNLNRYKHTSLGYALTTHKAQGSTVDNALVYTTPQRAARDMVYVQTSRARESVNVYCPGHDLGEDLADFERSLERDSGPKELATQVQESDERERQHERHLEEEELLRKRREDDFGLGLERGR